MEQLAILAVICLVVGAFVFWIWMILDCATKLPETGNDKIAWTIIIVFTHVIGAVLYFLFRRPRYVRVRV